MSARLASGILAAILLVVGVIAAFRNEAFASLLLGFFSAANFFATSRSQHEGAE